MLVSAGFGSSEFFAVFSKGLIVVLSSFLAVLGSFLAFLVGGSRSSFLG